MTKKRATKACVTLLACCCALTGQGCDDSESRERGDRGDMTSRTAVVRTLAASGYELRYRRVAQTKGYAAIAGEARDRAGGRVAFSVVVRRGGPYQGSGESVENGSPQLPVVPYAEQGAATTMGNIVYSIQPLSPYVIGRVEGLGRDWVPTRNESRMTTRIGSSLRRLFAPRFRGL